MIEYDKWISVLMLRFAYMLVTFLSYIKYIENWQSGETFPVHLFEYAFNKDDRRYSVGCNLKIFISPLKSLECCYPLQSYVESPCLLIYPTWLIFSCIVAFGVGLNCYKRKLVISASLSELLIMKATSHFGRLRCLFITYTVLFTYVTHHLNNK